jgi:CRP-like cAMP-binding protein
MSHSMHAGNGNRLLASLPSEDAAYLGSISRLSRPPQGQTLTRRSAPGSDVWFPHTGVVALTVTDALGRSVQTGLIGCEGCVGLEAVLDPVATLPEAVVQIEGPSSVISASQLRAAAVERPSIQGALSRFLYGLAAQSLQTIACNRLHSLLARCCRWLFSFQDRVASDDLPLTQENLATLLGNGRPGVNRLLAGLERNGLLRRHRGRIHLLGRSGLEEQACDCYGAVRSISVSIDLLRT